MYDLIRMPNNLFARKGTSDENTWRDVFNAGRTYHRPPLGLKAKVIFDLGAYVGYTAWDLSQLYPEAEIYAIEPDPQNFDLMNKNLYGNCKVYATCGAIANFDGVGILTGEHFNAKKITIGDGYVDVYTLDTFVGSLEKIDYIKFDIEGSERQVFKIGGKWPSKTKCLTVELHEGYTKAECAEDLYQLGFLNIREHKRHPDALVAFK